MFPTSKGIAVPSRPITVGGSGKEVLDMAFLHSYANRMRAPVIREFILHYRGDISGVTSGFDNVDGCQIFSTIRMRDKGGEFYHRTGKLARLDAYMELGVGADEVDGLADAASGATTSGDDLLLRIPFDLVHAHNGADTALPLYHLTEGGRVEFTFGTPAESASVTGSLVVYAVLHDEGRRELKSRLVRSFHSVSKKRDHYPIDGSIRSLTLTSDPSATGMSTWTSSTYTAISVPELEMSNMDGYILKEEYKRLRPDRSSSDPIAADDGIPLLVPSSGQRIDKMPADLRSITVDLGTTTIPTDAILNFETIEDRDPVLAAEWLGFSDARAFEAAINERGFVKMKGGKLVKATEFPAALVRRMPVVLDD